MTDLAPIRLSPRSDIRLATFDAHTSIGIVEAPVLVFEDERLGPVHLLLNPADNAAGLLCGTLLQYLAKVVEQEMRDEEDGESK